MPSLGMQFVITSTSASPANETTVYMQCLVSDESKHQGSELSTQLVTIIASRTGLPGAEDLSRAVAYSRMLKGERPSRNKIESILDPDM
jgi:hypothetical protein